MATLTWTGNAHATRQIDQIDVADTWAGGDTVTLTINGKDLIVTIGDDDTVQNVAAAIRNAWNATSRLDGTGSPDATSNFGGQEHGEFAECTASIDPDDDTIVLITANKAGVPFTLSVTETTAGDGTAGESTLQAATGPWHWNNGDNWDTGSAPVDDDVVVFRDSDIPCKYGLPNSTDLEVTINVYMSYTGQVGLPRINRENAGKPYLEYRQRYVRLDDGGSGTNIAHRFGIGSVGTGCTLFNLKHVTVKCSPIVYGTGQPQVPGTYALNICCTANTSTLDILNGSVDFSSQDSGTAAFALVKQSNGVSRCINGIHTSGAGMYLFGGSSIIGGSGAIATIQATGGTLTLEEQTGTLTTLYVQSGATVIYSATATITTLNVQSGIFDARQGVTGFTVTNCNVYEGSKFYDPARRITFTNDASFYLNPGPDIQMGANISSASLKINYV